MLGDASLQAFAQSNDSSLSEKDDRPSYLGRNGGSLRSDGASSNNSSSLHLPTMKVTEEDTLIQPMLSLSLESDLSGQQRTASPMPNPYMNGAPAITAPILTVSLLQDVFASSRLPTSTQEIQVKWIRDVLFLVNRTCAPSAAVSADPQVGPLVIDDPLLAQLADSAVELLLSLVPKIPAPGTKLAPPTAEALHHRATLTASGAFPAHLPENPRVAFRAFEASARAGYHASWFKLGRIYEAFGDGKRAKECFERGAKAEDVSCLYRLGMANLMGQLGLTASPTIAIPYLYRAAERASMAVPQPAYVYASLLLGDFAHASAAIPSSVFAPFIPATATIEQEAQRFLERAAYLHFTPAQYKLGHFYEFARVPYAYDPLLSVQYYTLASEMEPEACLALSKWFLCGAEGYFEKDELLARTFAERAARAGLSSAEFAMGYYWEVGIGCGRDMRRAKRWYEKSATHGNSDATERLASFAQNASDVLSRQDHEALADHTLVRRRTQAKQRSEAAGSVKRGGPREDAGHVVELVRKASKLQPRQLRPKRSSLGTDPNGEYLASSRIEHEDIQEIDEGALQNRSETTGSATSLATPQFPERKRYSLVDSGPSSRAASPHPESIDMMNGGMSQTPPRRYASPSPARTSKTGSEVGPSSLSTGLSDSATPPPGLDAVATTSPPAPRVRYSTFAEMGIQGQKLEGKDCIIM